MNNPPCPQSCVGIVYKGNYWYMDHSQSKCDFGEHHSCTVLKRDKIVLYLNTEGVKCFIAITSSLINCYGAEAGHNASLGQNEKQDRTIAKYFHFARAEKELLRIVNIFQVLNFKMFIILGMFGKTFFRPLLVEHMYVPLNNQI